MRLGGIWGVLILIAAALARLQRLYGCGGKSDREAKVAIWPEMIRRKIKVPPTKVRPKSNVPGPGIVFSGAVAVEAARREGYSNIEHLSVQRWSSTGIASV
jgi:hypothetical protein